MPSSRSNVQRFRRMLYCIYGRHVSSHRVREHGQIPCAYGLDTHAFSRYILFDTLSL